MTQLPVWVELTSALLVVPGSILNVTEFPDAPPVAVTAYVVLSTVAGPGAVEVKVMVCGAAVMVMVAIGPRSAVA